MKTLSPCLVETGKDPSFLNRWGAHPRFSPFLPSNERMVSWHSSEAASCSTKYTREDWPISVPPASCLKERSRQTSLWNAVYQRECYGECVYNVVFNRKTEINNPVSLLLPSGTVWIAEWGSPDNGCVCLVPITPNVKRWLNRCLGYTSPNSS